MRDGSAPLALCVEDDRQQRAALLLRNVAYVIEAHFEMTAKAGPDDNSGKHADMARRRLENGQCFQRPCLGTREFPADFEPAPPDVLRPAPPAWPANVDLGWMLRDIDFANGATPRFFHAKLRDGVLEVPAFPWGGERP